ncbi:MAG: hypothetical protein JXA57_18485 [Armatimonadetes bacterium]|nr:hypothetical protein [Armatimonadota bacterium]
MTPRLARVSRCCLNISLVLAVCLGTPALAEEATFRFDPPDGTTYLMTVTSRYVTDVAGAGRVTRTSDLAERVEVAKTMGGYTHASTLISSDSRSSTGTETDLSLEALQGKRIAFEIDKDLELTCVSGLGEVVKGLHKLFPAEAVPIVERALSEETMLSSMRAEWRREVLNLVGRSATVGSAWMVEESLLLPSGKMAVFHVAMKVTGEERMGGRPLLRVDFQYASDPHELAAFLGAENESLLADKVALTGEATVTGSGYRLVDPATLLTYAQKRRYSTKTTMTFPERGTFAVTFSADKTCRYDYSR